VAFRTDNPKRRERSKPHLRQRRHHHNALLGPCEALLVLQSIHAPELWADFLFRSDLFLAERKGGWDDIFKEW
jgi:hypothetical protein